MILPIIGVSVFLALLVFVSNHLAENRRLMMRRIILRVTTVFLLLVGLFLGARYWIIYGIRCTPDCVGENLLGRDLHGANLRNSDFAEANLRGANLSEADLYNADFSGANLDGVNLQNANLKGARLIGASLAKADLRGAQLGDTDLRGANLSETNFTQTNLTQVHLQGVTFAGAKLVEADLRGKNLAGVILTVADLTGTDLSGADLSGSRLSGANLSGASLQNTDLSGSWLNLANLTGANLVGSNLAGASLIGANLASANLSNSRLVGAILIGAHVNGANLSSADLSGVRLLASELIPIDLLTDPNLQELNELQLLQVIADVDLAGVSFNRQTQWPIGNTSTLAAMLGQQYYDYTTAAAASDSTAASPPSPPVSIVGSSTLMPLTQAILSSFAQAGYTQTVFLDSVDTDTAFVALCQADNVDIVMSHRSISEEESNACTANRRKPLQLTVGLQALVIAVNPENTFLSNVTLADLNALAVAGRWSDVNLDWPREEIMRYVPDADSVSFSFWAERIFGANFGTVESAINTIPSANGAQLIQGVVGNPYAIGVFDYALYQQNAGTLRLLSLDGIIPTPETVSSGAYSLTQSLYLYIDATRLPQTPQVREFVTYYLNDVKNVAEKVGLFPASAAMLAKAKQDLGKIRSLPTPSK